MNTAFTVTAAFISILTVTFLAMWFENSNPEVKVAKEAMEKSAYRYCLVSVKMGVSMPKECEAILND